MLQSVQVAVWRCEGDRFVTFWCEEDDFTRVVELMEERRNLTITPIPPPRPTGTRIFSTNLRSPSEKG